MRYVLGLLPALACAGLMYGCMKMMMSGSHRSGSSETPELEARVRELEDELARVRLEHDETRRTVDA